MSVTERAAEVRLIASVLWFLPAPAKGPIADKLHGLGIRMHPELADLTLQREGPDWMGPHAPQTPVRKDVMKQLEEIVEHTDPAFAAKIKAAKTDAEKQAVWAEVKAKHPDDVAQVDSLIEKMLKQREQ